MIKLIVLDVDGTLTDGRLYYGENGEALKVFNAKDGLAIRSWQFLGRKTCIMTGRNSVYTAKRAEELDISIVKQGIHDKLSLLKQICKEQSIGLNEVAAIGDDLNDLAMLGAVGKSFAPKNASHFVTSIVDCIVANNGGEGAVKDMIESIVSSEGLKEEYLSKWL